MPSTTPACCSRNWLTKGSCAYGEACNFAHGEHELRQQEPYYDGAPSSSDGYSQQAAPGPSPLPPLPGHPTSRPASAVAGAPGMWAGPGGGWGAPAAGARPGTSGGGSSAVVAADTSGPNPMDPAQLEALMRGFDLDDEEIEAFICPITHVRWREEGGGGRGGWGEGPWLASVWRGLQGSNPPTQPPHPCGSVCPVVFGIRTGRHAFVAPGPWAYALRTPVPLDHVCGAPTPEHAI